MAENNVNSDSNSHENILHDLKQLVWGEVVKQDIFERWSQGFVFSEDEPTALIQLEGGPCGVIAPVQAYLLKHAMSDGNNNWRKATEEQSSFYLRKAIVEIIGNGKRESDNYYFISISEEQSASVICNEEFHKSLRILELETEEELEGMYSIECHFLQRRYSALLFLYSILLTRGLERVKNEMSDPREPLIEINHGYGSQSLINLMITGQAVAYVWDNDRNVSGLALHGITSQSTIGFLTLVEHRKYCEVGEFLKSPKKPIWVLGSETHLTVLFSEVKALVCEETEYMVAERTFKSYDPDGNNFISASLLQNVLKDLDLVSDPEYVEVMKKKLDADNLGIILLGNFMEEFFLASMKPCGPDTFTIFHYNGLRRSCPDNKLKYQEGSAVLLESDIKCILDSNPIQTCLQTKWPSIEVQWVLGVLPSLN